MTLYAIGDLHLSFGVENKSMDKFGPKWKNHPERVKKAWIEKVQEKDLVLIPGDISWAMRLEEAVADLEWIDALPGTKVMIRGNHDYWWASLKKMAALNLKTIYFIQNNALTFGEVSIAGTRLWDTAEYNYSDCFLSDGMEFEKPAIDEKIYQRELLRLEESLKQLDPNAKVKVCMTHYPPTSSKLEETSVTKLLEKYNVDYALFGHLHGAREDKPLFGEKNGIHYILTSYDYLDCIPLELP